MKPHIEAAHELWTKLLTSDDLVVDATCGNGHDTLALVKLAKHVYSMDIQADALDSARLRTKDYSEKITWIHGCHSRFPKELAAGSVKLVVYNLGYLPGGDKSKTTVRETTLLSIKSALELICAGGMVCVTCYPGHEEGKLEQEMLVAFAGGLSREFLCCHHVWLNRPNSPTLLTLTKIA